jgi:hypothetical protein
MLRSEAYVKLVKRAETLVLSFWSKLEGRVYIILVCTLRVLEWDTNILGYSLFSSIISRHSQHRPPAFQQIHLVQVT